MDALPDFALLRPRTLDELMRARAENSASSLLGGGTDLIVNIRRGIEAPAVLIDLNGVRELHGIAADAQTLKQDIYQAHASAMAALQKFNASQKEVQTAQKAYDFARKRFDIGLLNAIDLITTQNTLFRAKITMASSQFDYVFRIKLLEFYKGQGIKL